MTWVIVAVVVVALGVAAVAATGGFGEMREEPVRDVYRQDLPSTPLTAHDLEALRFGVTFRGYAMDQVDDLLDRVRREVADRDARIADLQTALDGHRTPARASPESPSSPAGTSPESSPESSAEPPAEPGPAEPTESRPEAPATRA